MTCESSPEVTVHVTSVFVCALSVSGLKPEFVIEISAVCAGGVGPVLSLPPHAAIAIAAKGNARRTRMEKPPKRERAAITYDRRLVSINYLHAARQVRARQHQ